MLAVLATACGSATASGGKQIDLVAYSTPQAAYADLAPAFAGTPQGNGVTVRQSFGPSGAQSRAVLAGQPADVVEFSLEPDIAKLVDAGIVDPSWDAGPHHGIVTDSVVVFVVRKGNPLHIHDWADLVKPGVRVVTPNVQTSGSARWNLLAAYGAQVRSGRSPAQALGFVRQVLRHTVVQPESGAKALTAFAGGTGDVLLSYENEAIAGRQAGQPIDYVIPDRTILVENPIAVTTRAHNPALAERFVSFLYTDRAQRIFAAKGYRPVVQADLDPSRFPSPPHLFTIADLGGWPSVDKQFFDPDSGSIARMENDLGVSSGGS